MNINLIALTINILQLFLPECWIKKIKKIREKQKIKKFKKLMPFRVKINNSEELETVDKILHKYLNYPLIEEYKGFYYPTMLNSNRGVGSRFGELENSKEITLIELEMFKD